MEKDYLVFSYISVKKGVYVKKGDLIGRIGTTGISTGPHVHWSMMLNQTYIDPMIFLDADINN